MRDGGGDGGDGGWSGGNDPMGDGGEDDRDGDVFKGHAVEDEFVSPKPHVKEFSASNLVSSSSSPHASEIDPASSS